MSDYCVYLALDTETSGLEIGKSEILSFSGFLLDEELTIMRELTAYAHPSRMEDASTEALEINGYSPELWDARGATTQKEMLDKILTFLGTAKRLLPLGHNISFDVQMLRSLFKEFEKEKEFKNLFQISEVDTFSFALALDLVAFGKKQGGYKLTELCSRHGISLTDAHDARHDVLASLELLKYVVNVFRNAMSGGVLTEVPKAMVRPPQQESALIKKNDAGEWIYTKGKHENQKVSEAPADYARWALEKVTEFSTEQKAVLEQRAAEEPPKPKESRLIAKTTDGQWILNYGKHAGHLLSEVPRDYAKWMLDKVPELSEEQRKACEEHANGPFRFAMDMA